MDVLELHMVAERLDRVEWGLRNSRAQQLRADDEQDSEDGEDDHRDPERASHPFALEGAEVHHEEGQFAEVEWEEPAAL